MFYHGLHDFGLFALLTGFVLLTTFATVVRIRCERWYSRILWFAAASILSAAGWLGYHFGLSNPEMLDHCATVALATVVASMTSWFVRQRVKRQSADNASAARFQTLAEAIPQIVWIADAGGRTTYINKRWYEMTGTLQGGDVATAWMESVHADDRIPMIEEWGKCLRSGQTFEIEYRLHDSTHGYRWYLDRAVPLRGEKGVVQQWFGTCTDIEEQKHYQQILEQQIKERTEELAEANTRLQQEMWEKDLARRTLDEQNEEMMQALTERSKRATLLAKMGELLQSCQNREEVFTAALGFAPKIFPSRRGAMALFNPSHNLVEVTGQWHDCQLPVSTFEPDSCWRQYGPLYSRLWGRKHLSLRSHPCARRSLGNSSRSGDG